MLCCAKFVLPGTRQRSRRQRLALTSLDQDIDNITDAPVAARLREADVRDGYWVEEDPPLTAIVSWIRRRSELGVT